MSIYFIPVQSENRKHKACMEAVFFPSYSHRSTKPDSSVKVGIMKSFSEMIYIEDLDQTTVLYFVTDYE